MTTSRLCLRPFLSACVLLASSAPWGSVAAEPAPQGFVFQEIPPSSTDAENRSIRASSQLTTEGQTREIGYQTVLRTKTQLGPDANQNVFGQILDDEMKPVIAADGSKTVSNYLDFSSLLPVGGKLFVVSHIEAIPGGLYLTELNQDAASGKLTAKTTKALDSSGIHGVWNPCAGSVTPWGTHLGSEEYEPDASIAVDENEYLRQMAPYYGGGTKAGGDAARLNAYNYGWPFEVKVKDADGHCALSKRYSMGRVAHELSYVMPDRRTVYQSDDGANTGFFMYVADHTGDLSAGTLYALKWNQTSPDSSTDRPNAEVSWVRLGHATDADIRGLIDRGTSFAHIFETATPHADGTCPDGFKSVNVSHNDKSGEECLKLKANMEKAAAFLETRRYAGLLGATTELRKEEGITFDPEGKRLYVSYSEISYGMESNKKKGAADNSYDIGTDNTVKAKYNYCGGVYAFTVGSDSDIGSDYVLKGVDGGAGIVGRMTTLGDPERVNPSTVDAYADTSPYAGSGCAIDGIANPDNITFIPASRTLIIGEDTMDGHWNDMIWAYDMKTRTPTRIFTSPYGAEVTSTYYYPNVNGFGYLMAVVQHPYTEKMPAATNPNTPAETQAYLGYIGPLPAR